jgi:hypothetical protein
MGTTGKMRGKGGGIGGTKGEKGHERLMGFEE